MGTEKWVLKIKSLIYKGFLMIYRDEARHGKAFEGLLKRYFG